MKSPASPFLRKFIWCISADSDELDGLKFLHEASALQGCRGGTCSPERVGSGVLSSRWGQRDPPWYLTRIKVPGIRRGRRAVGMYSISWRLMGPAQRVLMRTRRAYRRKRRRQNHPDAARDQVPVKSGTLSKSSNLSPFVSGNIAIRF